LLGLVGATDRIGHFLNLESWPVGRLSPLCTSCPGDLTWQLDTNSLVTQAQREAAAHMPTLQRALVGRSAGREVADPDCLDGETPTKIINVFLRRQWTGQFRSKPCSHVYLARSDIGPVSDVCGKCVALGDSWPALRMCLLCGYVGCCDKSKNKHAREHFRQTGHPLMRPYKERGMDWVWCYVDEALLDPI
jgi:hypothetical protein